jgi:hypothetical protein
MPYNQPKRGESSFDKVGNVVKKLWAFKEPGKSTVM